VRERWPNFAPESAEEIGDGNLNLVFRVCGRAGSLIVKQALPYLRIAGEGWPLTLDRSRIEGEALLLHGSLAPGLTPRLHLIDLGMHVLVMEDLAGHTVWRSALIQGRHIAGVADRVGRYAARTLLGTSAILMPADERMAHKSRFDNPELCAITESLVFTAPYDAAASNRIDEAAVPIAEQLRADRALRQAAVRLRAQFRTRAEALIHGDLHTGSIMAAEGDARVMDPEFAFFGPIGFDVGNVFANLAFAGIRHSMLGNVAFAARVDDYSNEFWGAFSAEVVRGWPAGRPGRKDFLAGVLRDSAGFAGLEMVRRMVGLAHVEDIDALPLELRFRARAHVLAAARSLILGAPVTSALDLWHRATRPN
jgi:5-methylthioribose kinase